MSIDPTVSRVVLLLRDGEGKRTEQVDLSYQQWENLLINLNNPKQREFIRVGQDLIVPVSSILQVKRAPRRGQSKE